MCGQEGGKRGQWGLGKRLKPGELSLSMGPARMEVRFFIHISKYEGYLFTFLNTTHAIKIMYLLSMLFFKKLIFFPLQVKNKPCHGESEHVFTVFLDQWFVQSQKLT
jgi:hypothetical protein